LEINGIDLDGLAHEAEKIELPAPVKGRVLHVDADFLAYQCSAEKVDGSDQKTFDDMKHNAGVIVNTMKLLAGATDVHLHLTPSGSDKGRRFELAIQREYQGNRQDKPKPRYLHIMRDYMAGAFPATNHFLCEADDGMSSQQYAAILAGQADKSIIASKDKDLNQVPGLHLDWDTGTIIEAGTFGEVYLRTRPSGTKVLSGYGQKFFWAQMLVGDTADNIQGLPKLVGHFLNIFKPTAQTSAAQELMSALKETDSKFRSAQKLLADRKAGACGPVLVAEIMARVNNHNTAFKLVKAMYEKYGQEIGFKHWKTGEDVPWQKVFVSEAQLLWMRRNPHDHMDVINFFREVA